MPCCGGHSSGGPPAVKSTFFSTSPAPALDGPVVGALENLSVLRNLAEHCDAATAAACFGVSRAWRDAFGLSVVSSQLASSETLDGTRARFIANLHGAVTLDVTQAVPTAQRGFDRHIRALAANRHFAQLKVHVPVREASEPQLSLGCLTALGPLTQLSSLVISRNPSFTSAPHVLTEADVAALAVLKGLTFLELCAAVPPPLGLGPLAALASGQLTALRTLAFGHTSALWRVPEVAALCRLLDGPCPALTDLRLRCVAPPRDAKQLPDLLAQPLALRLTNFALTFARRLGRSENHNHHNGPGGAPAGAAVDDDDDDDEERFGEYEDLDEPWDSVDHLAPKPGLHVLIVEKGTTVTRMDINVTVSVAASDLPTVSMPSSRRNSRRNSRAGGGGGGGGGGVSRTGEDSDGEEPAAAAAAAAKAGGGGSGATGEAGASGRSNGAGSDAGAGAGAGAGLGGSGAVEEEDVPPFDVTPMVLSEYERLLGQELGLTGSLAEPEDLHLGVRLDILEDDEDPAAAAIANLAAAAGVWPPGHAPPPLNAAALLHVLQQQGPMQVPNEHLVAAVNAAAGQAAAAAGGGAGGGGMQALLDNLLNNLQNLNLGGGPGGGGAGAGGAAAARRRGGDTVAARLVQLQLAPLSPHMCYLNLALVPMVTQMAVLGPDGQEEPGGAPDTPVAPVLLDVRGGGYTQLKSLAVTGYVDQDCRPATWMSRGWLSRVPTGMPSLEYLALYDTLPAAANDPSAIQGLRSLSRLEHLELRPLYLRFSGDIPTPLSVPPPTLPPKLLQLTLKKVAIPTPPASALAVLSAATAAAAGPSTSTGAAGPSAAAVADALACLPDLPHLTHLWLFDCSAPDLTVFRRAPRLEDLRLGGTTTTTRLPDLLASFPCLRGAILDVGEAVAPGWWSAGQLSCLASLRCLRSLQLDAATLEPAAADAKPAAAAGGGKTAKASAAGGAAAGPAGAAAAANGAADSDDDSDAYLSTEEDPSTARADGAAGPPGGGASGSASDSDLASVLRALAGLTQLTDLTLSFDTPTLFYDLEEQEEAAGPAAAGGAGPGGAGSDSSSSESEEEPSEDSDDESSDVSSEDEPGAPAGAQANGGGAAGPAAAAAAGGAAGGGGGKAAKGGSGAAKEAASEQEHSTRVCEALLSGQSLAALAALQGLWRLRVGLPHGTVWEDASDRLLPALRLAMPRTAVEMDVL
ncbi:hypothetical protein HYH03_005389 [Edaphochlamys debaryana]|uniref:Uncharacterized protein n=1 Tax=Edaphochlamys debaryana TaxID=47281 RepID=A0A835Y7P9_9CHLO|nr:hypothetical protein HYH03_005389 [Edaphochlamys debaryana]|eukprot:KAG2496567.1 hypothetical protein HYH03_005389 [Edaphochlamys debaryana]